MCFEALLYIVLGLIVGVISDLIGIGGGVLVTPVLIYWFNFSHTCTYLLILTFLSMKPREPHSLCWRLLSGC